MKEFANINDVLDFAIDAEQEAVEFYTKLSSLAKTSDMKLVFEEFAREEISHKAKLTKIKESGVVAMPVEKVLDLKISDYHVKTKASPDMSYADSLILAMSKEKAAYRLYTTLASRVNSDELKNLFLSLAMEESRHKLQFEIEYDEYVLREN